MEITICVSSKQPVKISAQPGATVEQVLALANKPHQNALITLSREGQRRPGTLGSELQDKDIVFLSSNVEGGN